MSNGIASEAKILLDAKTPEFWNTFAGKILEKGFVSSTKTGHELFTYDRTVILHKEIILLASKNSKSPLSIGFVSSTYRKHGANEFAFYDTKRLSAEEALNKLAGEIED